MLAVGHGGEVLVRERNGQLIPERAVYRVVLTVDTADGPAPTLREALQALQEAQQA